jgi:protein-L-isoaspartate(D-aspartate) O-methyltransferase
MSTVYSMADDLAHARVRMVQDHLAARGISDRRVLDAMLRVRRDELVPPHLRHLAYADQPLEIGSGQTISQPFVVAAMTQAAQLTPASRVLELGTGSGYQTAVLCELVAEVYSIEIVPALAASAAAALARLGYTGERLHLRTGDGYGGWPEAAPFDAILAAAAPLETPPALVAQLAIGGRLVIPVGGHHQELLVITREVGGETTRRLFPVRFVPMTGQAQQHG